MLSLQIDWANQIPAEDRDTTGSSRTSKMQRFDARNHRFVWIEIRLFNPIDLIFESVCHSDGPPAAPRNRILFKVERPPLDIAH